ncbi:acetylornithine deacetylase [Methylocapsa palsarum]|uniref:Acetylornithine deacetylase n=1 Tax=Methylocapsa palsarum TaxID=1612308 RepID=A0A1I4AZ83_9HYPH|nr:acetylornithine deacetylase [Methylocapsa palsarum]SFK61888.1 acetylornithine deacetylase [Methylocapsa palsarum]
MSPPADGADRSLLASFDLLERLISFDTESSKSNLGLIAHVEDYLAANGVEYVKVPNASGDKAALFATIGPKIDGGVVLSGHTDIVPVEGQAWTSDPFRLRRANGRLYGRGACDMKGFDAICLAMIPEFQKARLTRPIHLLLSYDEETTCRGPLETIARFGADLPRPGAVLVGEPTLMQVADAHKAVATYCTTVHGHEAHSSKPDLGANAIEAACDLVTELYRLAAQLAEQGDPSGRFDPPCSTIQVGVINGGTARNILAKLCTFHWEFRSLPGVRQSLALDHFNAYAARVVTPKLTRYAKDAFIETVTEVEVPGLMPDRGSAAESLALKLARSNRTVSVPFASEAGQFQQAEIPTVVCGPGSIDQAHQPDEFIEIAQIEAGLAFLRRLAAELS